MNRSFPSIKPITLSGANVESKRAEIRNYFIESYDLYESLYSLIKSETSYFYRYEPLRHPLIFYFAHTATFFINKLITANLITKRINPDLESLMSVGVDEMSWDDLDKTNYDWPSVRTVKEYRNLVKELVVQFIDTMDLKLPITQEDPAWIILMGIEHERIHLETSSVIMRQMPLDLLHCESGVWRSCKLTEAKVGANSLLPVKEKKLQLGKSINDETYGWDNEYGVSEHQVGPFLASKYLVSNQEFLEFVLDKGYQTKKYWTQDEGWPWVQFSKASHPRFWIKEKGSEGQEIFFQRNLLERIPLPLSWPVEVNQLEAHAFCEWKASKLKQKIALPTEAQWYALCENISDTDWQNLSSNIGLMHGASSHPVDQFKQGDFFDLRGNVWQWTKTPIYPFTGFKVHPTYDDFSVPTFDGRHNLMKGGSWISTGNEAIKSSRYAFRRHFYQHAGFRYVQNFVDSDDYAAYSSGSFIYETDDSVAQYIEFHFGEDYFSVPNFPKNCIEQLLAFIPKGQRARALDLGCSVGRSSFELSKYFSHVDAIDFSTRFIQVADRMQNEGSIHYEVVREGKIKERKTVELKTFSENHKFAFKNIHFSQGDACNLKSQFHSYDVVFAGNLIDRLYDPRLFLEMIAGRILPGGFLVLTSPYTWLTDYTPHDKWIGGRVESGGSPISTMSGLKSILEGASDHKLSLLECRDIPFVIRETARKFQHSIAEMSIWKKV
ncbi:MAG: 5-histidylcysteine sulfoxide synthase [Bacteriovoracaceae bacterium]|nr:5-histidylcysteine sulfoxide synthase [Bacteriovoracaceae bacterium]